MSTKQNETIAELRNSLEQILKIFQSENTTHNFQAKLERWRITARNKIKIEFGEEESELFNNISLNVGFSSPFYDNQNDMSLDYIQQAAAYLEALEGAPVGNKGSQKQSKDINPDPKKVFVVHGRNEALNRALFAFLRSLKLTPLEWEEAVALVGGSPFPHEVIIEGMKHAQATVILLTPDEEVKIRQELANGAGDPDLTAQFQPRPNVLFEAGIALALDARRSIIVEIGAIRQFSDMFGRHLIRLDNTTPKRNALAVRLSAAGCAVETSGNHWIDEGNFTTTLSSTVESQTKTSEKFELTEPENEIIQFLAKNKKGTTADFKGFIKESDIRIEYYLNRLQTADLVGAIINMGGAPAKYFLYESGIKYAVEKLNL